MRTKFKNRILKPNQNRAIFEIRLFLIKITFKITLIAIGENNA